MSSSVKSKIIASAINVLRIESEAIIALAEHLDENFEKAIDLLYNCKGRVVVTGMGKSGIIGRKISATLSSTGTPSFFMHPAEGSHGDSGAVMKNDVVLAISNSGETQELMHILPLIKRLGLPLISLTGNTESTLAQKSDVVLSIYVEKEACSLGLAPTASTTVTLALGDALAVVLLEKRGFTPEDFLMFHPSGSLGKGLIYKVEDLMITGESLPIVSENVTFQNALITVSDKKLGFAIVVDDIGKLAGIITDGDIRRALLKTADTAKLTAKQVMTLNPKSISKNEFAASALQIMETYKITSLLILREDKTPEGILHIHDLLKAGVA